MFRRILLLFRTFTPVESRLLCEVEARLPSATRDRFARQIKKINHVQRLLDWHEINFYCMRGRNVAWDSSIAFANKAEFTFARMEFEIQGRHFRGELKAVSGYVFALVTRPSIKTCWYKPITHFTAIEVAPLLADSPGPTVAPKNLPPSYLEWLSQPHCDDNDWLVLNPEQTYIVSLPDSDYRVIATRGQESLMSQDGITPSPFFHVDSDDPAPREVGHSFQKAISM